MSKKLKDLFNSKKLTLGSVESFTGGLFASTMVKTPGASSFFKGALVTYATEEKIRLLGVSKKLVKKYGVVSRECAAAMAEKGLKKLKVDCCVSFTGNAGPDAMEGKPAGLVYIGVATKKGTDVLTIQSELERNELRRYCVQTGEKFINEKLK